MLEFLSLLIFYLGMYTYIGIEKYRIRMAWWLILWIFLPSTAVGLCLVALFHPSAVKPALGSSTATLIALIIHVASHMAEFRVKGHGTNP